MKKLPELSIRKKLIFLLTISILSVMILGISILLINHDLEYKTRKVATILLPGIFNANNILTNLEHFRITEYKFSLSGSSKEKDFYIQEMKDHQNEIDWNMRVLRNIIENEKELKLFESFQEDQESYRKVHQSIIDNSAYGQNDSARHILTTTSRNLFTSQVQRLHQLIINLRSKGQNASDQIHSEVITFRFIFGLTIPLVIILLIVLYYSLARSIMKNASEISRLNLNLRNEIQEKNTIQQDLIQKTSDLNALDNMKEQLLSVIAHDIRNYFGTILGFIDLIIHDSSEIQPEDLKSYNEMISRSANSGLRLLENLLEWTRMISGKINIQPASFSLHPLVEENIKNNSAFISYKEIQVENEIEISARVFADQNMVNTIIRNLFHNALKYSFKGGVIRFFSNTNGQNINLVIEDTGVGMSPEEIDHLCANHQESKPGTMNEKGTGVGLLICKEFIEKNNGTIKAEAKDGGGSRFIITLPSQDLSNH